MSSSKHTGPEKFHTHTSSSTKQTGVSMDVSVRTSDIMRARWGLHDSTKGRAVRRFHGVHRPDRCKYSQQHKQVNAT